jgi:hypothetical protein
MFKTLVRSWKEITKHVILFTVVASLSWGASYGWSEYKKASKRKVESVIVVDKVVHETNLSYATRGISSGGKLYLTFIPQKREAEYLLVGLTRDGVEYNVQVDKYQFYVVKLLDTLYTE